MDNIVNKAMYDIREDLPKEALFDVGEITREEAMDEYREQCRDETREATLKAISSNTSPFNESPEAAQQRAVQRTTKQSTSATEDTWEDDSDAEYTTTRLAPYKKAKLQCMKCNTTHTDLRLLMNHMLKNHSTALSSTYWQCCANQVWNASLLSYVPHWGGVHGFSKEPFPCPRCDCPFKSMPDVRRHWIGKHKTPVGKAKNSRSNATKILDVLNH